MTFRQKRLQSSNVAGLKACTTHGVRLKADTTGVLASWSVGSSKQFKSA